VDSTFDGVVVQAVLEHVVDPGRCVEEMCRVLKDEGLVYAETPFLQQVHGGPYDFTRFTHLGHRRLFRNFVEINSGATAGSGTALAWAYQYFLLSFVTSKLARSLVKGVARLTSFWLRYFDYYLLGKPGTLDAALGYYFLGKKSRLPLPDREMIKFYRGAGSVLPIGRASA
jgi:SAM-dependent methyltransferase